jgi:hypothetical protein
MKRPHETTLSVVAFDKERICLVEDGRRMVAVLRNFDAEEWEAFLKAAPDMARALLAFLPDHGHTAECGYSGYPDHACSTECANARAALSKAGVLT